MKIGINLAALNYWHREFPFIDRIKLSGPFAAQNADSAAIPYNEHGWPTGAPPGATNLYFMVPYDPVGLGGDNRYVLAWEGKASFGVAGAQEAVTTSNRIEFTYSDANSNSGALFLFGLDAADPLRDAYLVRADQEAAYLKGETFTPAFLERCRSMACLRHMDWNATNANQTVEWSGRTLPSDRTWFNEAKTGAPVEVQVRLHNEAETGIWLCVPSRASDDYVRRLCAYVRDTLDPSLALHLEYSNEVWNWSFDQSHYALVEGDELWGTDANKDGRVDENDSAEHFGPGWVTFYGYRAAQVAAIANEVFSGCPDRLRTVLSTQTDYRGLEGYIADGVSRAKLGSIADLFDEYAVTGYIGGTLRGVNDADKAVVESWTNGGDEGMAKLFAGLSEGISPQDTGSIAFLKGLLDYHAPFAKQNNLALVIYEGGLDIGYGVAGPAGSDANRANPSLLLRALPNSRIRKTEPISYFPNRNPALQVFEFDPIPFGFGFAGRHQVWPPGRSSHRPPPPGKNLCVARWPVLRGDRSELSDRPPLGIRWAGPAPAAASRCRDRPC